VLLGLNTLFWTTLLCLLSPLKLIPASGLRRQVDALLNGIATTWVAGNSGWMRLTQPTRWDVQGLEDLPAGGWALVVCNHQSWVDIFVLQHLLNRRIPLLKFFLKRELIYVPVIGLAWWALDFPFMRRHGEAALRRHPEKRLQDIEATRLACLKFSRTPTSVMNFVEGTRFTAAKHAAQGVPWRHLLQPKAGGLAMALAVLGERFDTVLDTTIVYPDGAPTFWQFLRGEVPRITVRVQRHPIPADCRGGDPVGDRHYRQRVQRWLNDLWRTKDQQIDTLLAGDSPATEAPPVRS
jgi:1-acyl-sn-glycerol-3-phosphate acyltransferase